MTEVDVPPPTARGSLEKTPFVHLLIYLADREFSGSLVVTERDEPPGQEHTIYFFEGTPAKFRTGQPIAHLGRVLFELGHLSEQALTQSLSAIAGVGELHGEFLIRTGVIDRSRLMDGLVVQAKRKMAFLFGLPSSATYAFYQDTNLLDRWGGAELTPLEPLANIWSAARARGNEPVVDVMLDRLGTTILRLHEKSDVGRFGFSPQELAVVDLIRARPCTLGALIESGVVPKRTIELIVYALLVTRHLDHGASAAPPVASQRPSDSMRQPSPSSTHIPLARVKLAARTAEVPESGPVETPRPSSRPPGAERAPSSSKPPLSDRSRGSSSNPPPLTAELTARRDSILRRAEGIDKEDYFAMLGIAKGAAEADIQGAYYALAKTWHPDRLPVELSAARDAASKVFARMSEAFDTLSDPNKRKRYVDVVKGGGGTPEEADKIQLILDAAADFQRGEILWKKHDPGAEEFVARAYRADPDQSDYGALYALIHLSKRTSDAPVDDLFRICERAIETHERCERAYFCRALLRKRMGRVDLAIADFRAAYEINPKNIDAAREVRLYEMRRAKHPDRQSGPQPRRSNPPATKSNPVAPRSSIPPRKSPSTPTKKEGGVLSGLGKLFKR